MVRPIALAALLSLLGCFPASAGPPEPPCWAVRFYVSVYGERVTTLWALAHGYSREEIAITKARCGLATH